MSETVINGVRQYCAGCYGQAAKAGRIVRQTNAYEFPLCGLCERRVREGLVRYRPSNGTEYMMFDAQCGRCRHHTDDGESPPSLTPPYRMCAWGVLDRLTYQMGEDADHPCNWFDPADLRRFAPDGRLLAPADCLRFTDKRDGDGERRDPPRPDCEGQLTFSDLLTVHEPSAAERAGKEQVTA
jgi:hypothetical protein